MSRIKIDIPPTMLKPLILLFLIASASACFSQLSEVKFTEKSFENGMAYPQLVISDKALQDSINANIETQISDLKQSDFCIGQYGYVQKRTHLQIHIFCNCIEFSSPQNRYLFYNLTNGKHVPYSDITDPLKANELNSMIITKSNAFLSKKGITMSAQITQEIESYGIDAFQVVMQRGGLDLWLPNLEGWGVEPLSISWVELSPFLKYQFM